MKKKLKNSLLASFLFMLGIGFSFGQTTTIDFETENDGYTASATEGSGFTDVFNRTNPNKGGNSTYMWSVEDLSLSNPFIDLNQISTTGSSSFTFAIDMIAHHFNDWDNSDELLITYSTDGGVNYQNLMWVQNTGDSTNAPAAIDNDFNGDGDCGVGTTLPSLSTGTSDGCTTSNNQFETFTSASIDITGNSTLDIKLQFNGLTSGDEGIYLDNLTIVQSGSSTPTVGFDTAINLIAEADSGTNSLTAPITMNIAPSSDVVVNVTLNDGTATIADNDYSGPASNDLTFTTGATYPLTLNADFTIIGDTNIETDEDFTLDFTITSGTVNTGTTTHTVTIINDDSHNNCFTDNDDFEKVEVTTNSESDVWTFSGGTYSMNGFNSGGSQESNQWLILGDLDLSSYAGSDLLQLVLDATEGFDGTDLTINITDTYTGCPDDAGNSWVQLGTITGSGITQTFDISTAAGNNSVYIGIQYLDNDGSYSSWNLSNMIIETDNATCFTINTPIVSNCILTPIVNFDTSSSSVAEGDAGSTSHDITVTISADPIANVVVDIITNEVSATEDTDYTGTLVTLTFTPGGALTQNVSVPIIGDTDVEANETFTADLSLSSGTANIGTNSHTVTINDDDVLVITPCSDLFFSKYVEGSSSNKYLEIYNPTNSDIDLSDYSIVKYTNGSTTASSPFNLSGTLVSNDVLIIERDIESLGVNADISTSNTITIFNGDDVIALQKFGTNIDIIGKIGEDPGVEWVTNGVSTKDMTLIRKVTIQQGDSDGSDTFSPDIEWLALPQDQVDYFGFHDSQCSGTSCISTTVWNGFSWSNGDPTITSIAIFDGDFDIDTTDINSCEVYVSSTAILTIKSNHFLNVNEDITNKGLFLVENQGSVVQVNDAATVTGDAVGFDVEITTTVLQDEDRFTYFSSPTNAGDISIFSGFTEANWEYDSTIQNWAYLGDNTATRAMNIGQAYAIKGGSGTTETVDFSGAFNNGIITKLLSFNVYNDLDDDGLGGDTLGFGDIIIPGSTPFPNLGATNDDSNFVGNPYPSAINADILIGNNDISGVYIWTHESAAAAAPTAQNPYIDNDYIECVIGTCTDLNNGGDTTSAYQGFIASGQGFFVVATDATNLTFNNAMRVTDHNDEFRSTENQKLWLNMTTEQGYSKQIALTFTENGTANYDVKYEVKSLVNNYGLGFCSLNTNNDKLSINDTGILNKDRTIPLGFYINSPIIDGATISIGHSQNLENVNVYLVDNLLNVTHDLKANNYQIAITETAEVNDRFEIVFNRNPLSTNDTIITNDTLVVSNQNTQIKVNMLDGNIITAFKAFDVLGKLVIDMKPNKNSFIIDTNFKPGQVLFIKATLENGQVLSNKFMKL